MSLEKDFFVVCTKLIFFQERFQLTQNSTNVFTLQNSQYFSSVQGSFINYVDKTRQVGSNGNVNSRQIFPLVLKQAMSTGVGQVVDNGQNLVNIVSERPLRPSSVALYLLFCFLLLLGTVLLEKCTEVMIILKKHVFLRTPLKKVAFSRN